MRRLVILTLVLLLTLPLLPALAEDQYPYLAVNSSMRLTVADVVSPRYSPDGSFIAFIAKGPSNTIVYGEPNGSNQRQIAFIDNPIWSLSFKPDGSKLVLIVATTGKETGQVYTDVVTVSVDGKNVKFLTNSTNYNSDPVFLPDGRIAFTSQKEGVYTVWVMDEDGSNQKMWLTPGLEPLLLGPSPTREEVLFIGKPGGADLPQLFISDLSGDHIRQITNIPGGARGGTFSPDGERIAFVIGEEGKQTIGIVNRDGSNQYVLASMATTLWRPSWSPDGEFIIFPAMDYGLNKFRIFTIRPDGNDLRPLSPDYMPSVISQVQWRVDGEEVIFLAKGPSDTNNIWRMELARIVPAVQPPEVTPTPMPTPTPTPSDLAFSDIWNHWAEKNIAQLKEMGIIQGFPDGSFHPNDPLKRVEFATFLFRAMGYPASYDLDPFFDDVPPTYWGFPSVQSLVLKKVVARDGSFYPEESITRMEIIMWEVRALGLEQETAYRSVPELPFSDLGGLTELQSKYIATARELQLIDGYPDGTLRLEGLATRAEATVLLFRLLDSLKQGS
ncbi:MAG: S-layer homology domain-containing protein [Coprothermobacterota bacterium]|nr:S-layer homology domain-containing protein [Coprothermobacterota bacterium]